MVFSLQANTAAVNWKQKLSSRKGPPTNSLSAKNTQLKAAMNKAGN